jgi:hypothetical protein
MVRRFLGLTGRTLYYRLARKSTSSALKLSGKSCNSARFEEIEGTARRGLPMAKESST